MILIKKKLPLRIGVGIVLLNTENKIFVGKRIDNPANSWQMPQGGVDDGEDPRDAALRGLGEETGITPSSVEVVAQTADWIPYELPHDQECTSFPKCAFLFLIGCIPDMKIYLDSQQNRYFIVEYDL